MGLASESRARSFALAQLSRLEPGVCEHPNGSTVLRAGPAHRTQAVKSHQPQTIRTDNGIPFAGPTALYRLSKLAVWWLRLGIRIERIQPDIPSKTAARTHTSDAEGSTRSS